jgi:hypothetical protein
MKDQKALKCIPIARLTFAVGLIFQQTLVILGKWNAPLLIFHNQELTTYV